MSIEQNIENLEIRNANVVTFVGSSSTIVDTISGRIQCKGFQHNSNVITDISGPHGRIAPTLKKYPEIAFDASKADVFGNSNAYAQAGYEISSTSRYETGVAIDANDIKFAFDGRGDENGSVATPSTLYPHYASQSSSYSTSNPFAYTLFTNNVTDKDGVNYSGEEIKLKLPNKIKLSKLNIVSFSNSGDRQARNGHIFGSNTGANGSWTKIIDFTNLNSVGGSSVGTKSVSVSTVEYFEWYSLVITHLADSGGLLNLRELEYYGYEEDPPAGDHSVDTTFKSRFNNPQLTGVQVFVDGKGSGSNQIAGGPTVTDVATTYNEPGKYWELTGELTSNIAVEANTFLEGDQPHAVSVWFNSSNLEANVSNTCVFSVSDQEHLNSQNLDLQSNTWHNLTYAYQGEGGSKVTYLDGRKVAEDQAEDTFGDYPPFAMTGYSQGGYVASSSSEGSSGTRNAFKAFDKSAPSAFSAWSTEGGFTSGVYSSGGSSFTLNGSSQSGHWLKIELPHKLHVSYVEIIENGNAGFKPTSGFLIGSNDDQNWDVLKQYSGLTYPGSDYKATIVSESSKAYKYILLLIQTLDTNSGTYTFIEDFHIYGHRENDLVHLPDPTNVLKYPHVVMTGPAQRGYVASESSHYALLQQYAGWKAFDAITDDPDGWVSANASYQSSGTIRLPISHSTGSGGIDNLSGIDATSSGGDTSRNGSWLKIKLPHKLKLSQMKLFRRQSVQRIVQGFVYGSNDNITFYQISNNLSGISNIGTYSNTDPLIIIPTDTTTAYKYFVVQVTASSTNHANIGNLEFYGTGVDSIPIQIGGGNIDKVANFRVYDKFVGEDQALEIWDAQKDEFGRAKSSMTLQKGRLGIGTDEPQGRLAVLDEPHNLEEFPPRAMTGYKTYFEGHGEFCVSTTTEYSGNLAWEAFDKITSSGATHWSQANPSHYDNGSGVYTGPSDYFTNVEGHIALGHWLQIEFPYKIKYSYSTIQAPYHTAGRQPHTGYIVGSNDLSGVWTSLHNYSGMTRTGVRDFVTYTPPTVTTQTFKYFRLVIEKLGGGNADAGVDQWNIFGTREQGQSVLHDGQLTLTKNLNVPRIGPALDADDTPRRDRLVVEYNTSTSQATGIDPTFGGVVRDTSGRGNDGVYYRRAAAGDTTGGYNATEKALQFTTTNTPEQHIKTSIGNRAGAYVNSGSFWINAGTMSANMIILQMGKGADAATKRFQVALETTGVISFGINGSNTKFQSGITTGSWFHVAYSYDGGVNGLSSTSYKLYINGVSKAIDSGTSSATLNLDADAILVIGSDHNATTNFFNGSISQFKLYDTALTASEAKTLYDMGRCDEGHHVVNFSKTRVGIGLGDGEAPHDELEIRGNVRGSDNVIVGPYSGQWWRLHTFQGNGNLIFFGEDGTEHGYLVDSGTVNNIDFTGQHRAVIDKVNVSDYENFEGLIVSANKNKYINVDNDITTGSNAIQISQSLPLVSLSNVVHDKACYGVIAGSEDVESRTYEQGTFVSVFQKQKGDTRAYINSVGEGAIWVVNTNGSLESGDYITTSNVAGYGQKQTDDILHNYTVAKITMDCDFNPATQPIQQILRSNVIQTYYLGNVHKVKNVPHEFVTTTVTADDAWSNVSINPSDTTYAEWSNLEANTQNTYTLTYTQTSNVVYDTKYTLTTTANVTESDSWDRVSIDPPGVTYAEYSNLEANTQSSYSLTFTKTTTDEKTPGAWSNLESNTQSLYNKVYYQSVEEEVAKDYPGAVAHTRVTNVIENELDEHGQIQWEDHATETEKAYKIRYLDASGVETDSANVVHIAAFVGCTYHCG